MKNILILSILIAIIPMHIFAASTVKPLAMTNKALASSTLKGQGLSCVGLLVKLTGNVTYVDTTNKFFYIDDGSGIKDGSGCNGIRVSYADLATGNTFNPPQVNKQVIIVGISSTSLITLTNNNQKIVPTLLPRCQDDMSLM